MLNFCLANKYADVLLDICYTEKEVFEKCQQLLNVFEENCLLNEFFSNKNVNNEEKIKIINFLGFEKMESLNKFFGLLIKNNRAEYIKTVLQIFFQKLLTKKSTAHLKNVMKLLTVLHLRKT